MFRCCRTHLKRETRNAVEIVARFAQFPGDRFRIVNQKRAAALGIELGTRNGRHTRSRPISVKDCVSLPAGRRQ